VYLSKLKSYSGNYVDDWVTAQTSFVMQVKVGVSQNIV